ncbi:TBPIP-domain-containing protein [Lentinula aff. lateritia]|uniref:TBPIP-domain-containing protein n=1 Tax=Lentinula aff. lateritia TaxID=2804960 RepID=A0ACC1U825_9AGAR|nr:TBPIP-domain-containing protein [Lentinula aff. lateritia]
MASKQKSDVKVLKGQEAENKVLEYVRRMNRPYGAVDVAANLKGAVPKATTQKILVALAEKGELVQKNYGKTTFFVANQAKIDTLSPEKISALEEECKKLDEENKAIASQIKAATTELTKIKNLPSDLELDEQLASLKDAIAKRTALLQPLRSGAPPISTEEIAQIDADWLKWREEWIRRKKTFNSFWQLATDSLPPQDTTILSEDLGIEYDTPEHAALEKSHLCADTKRNLLKRKR